MRNPIWFIPIGLAAMMAAMAPGPSVASGGAQVGASAWAGPSPDRGRIVYEKACAACHGDRGDGNAPAAVNQHPRPRDFTSGTFKFRSTANGEMPTDQDLLRVVENGVPGTQMPAWKGILGAKERADVVAYIKTFSEDFQAGVPVALEIPKAPAGSPAWVAEGRSVYMLMECWACHGGKGRGDGRSGRTLEDDWGRKILPTDLTRHRYKAGNDPESLYRTFSTGLNGTPMPAYALEGFLIPGDGAFDPVKYREAYGPSEIGQLREWLAGQPGESALGKMTPEERNALGEKRKWALVHYIRSLVRKPNFLTRVFAGDPESTP